MKKLLILFPLFVVTAAIKANERVIIQPPFIAWSSTVLEIDRIVLTDTATILYMDAYYNGMIMIGSESYLQADGEKYIVRNADGIELGKNIYMPESGTLSLSLTFPPLPKSVTEIDFMEGEWDGAFCIWGIRLDGQPIKSGLEGKTNPETEAEFESPILKAGNVTLSGCVSNYNPSMNFKGTLYANSIVNGTESHEIVVQKDGTFSVSFPALHIMPVNIYAPFMNGHFFLKPGETTYLEINLPEICRSQSIIHKSSPSFGNKYFFSGALGNLNNNFINRTITDIPIDFYTTEEYSKMLDTIWNMTPEQYKAFWMDRYENGLKILEQYSGLSKAIREYLIINLKSDVALELLTAQESLTYAYKQHNNIDRETALPDSAISKFNKEYYHFLSELLPHDSSIVYLENLSRLFIYLSLVSLEDIPLIPAGEHAENTLFAEMMGKSTDDFIYKLINTKNLVDNIANFTPLTEQEFIEAETISPEVGKYVKVLNEGLIRTIEESTKKTGYIINPVDTKDIPKEDLFAAIMEQYRGKVVFVDFWATWCAPCFTAMEKAKPVKEMFKGKDVVFLYLAGENSPQSIWEQKIPDIEGEHYRVTNEQWKYWENKFNMQGVPSYMIIRKNGIPVHFQTGFMGTENMRRMISNALEEL